jgi:putative hydrolase of the HAD superfamily
LIRAVLFDAVDTLIELREPVGESYARIARQHGVEISAWRLEDAFRRVLAQAPAMLFPDAAAADVPARERAWWRGVVRSTFLAADSAQRFRDFDTCFEDLWRHFAAAGAWRTRAGARELLHALRRRGLLTAVVSNFDARLPVLLEGLGLAPLLDAVVLPCEARALKPDAAIFATALERLGVAAPEALFVGNDAQRDLQGARAAGLRALDAGCLATLDALPIPDDEVT